jgi:PAS domain S-box-containing protein
MERKGRATPRTKQQRTHVAGTRTSEQTKETSPLLDSADRFRELVENANDAIALVSSAGIIEFVNRGAEKLLGWTRKELRGSPIRKVVTPATLRLVEERTTRFSAGERLSSIFDAELLHKNGTVVPVEARARVIRDDAGQVIGYQGVYRDVSERKRAEQTLREREAYFRALSERTADMITILGADGSIRYASPSAERILGFSSGEVLGQKGFDFIHVDDLAHVQALFAKLLTNPGETPLVELRVRDHQGHWRDVEATGANLLDDPLVQGIVINSRDITARKKVEQELRDSEERYRRVSESISDYAFSYSIDERGDLSIEWLTDSFTEITGYSVAELIGTPNPLHVYIHPEDLETVLRTVKGIKPGTVEEYTFRILTKDKKERWLQSRARVLAENGKVVRLYGAAHDITATRKTTEDLRASEEFSKAVFEAAPDVIYTLNTDGILTSLNPAFTVRTGWPIEEWKDKLFLPLLHKEDQPHAFALFQQLLADQDVGLFTLRVETKDGGYRVGEFRAVPQKKAGKIVSVLGISRDITDREEAKARLEEQRQLLARITDTMPEVLYLYDLNRHEVAYINSRITAALGYTPEFLVGKSIESFRSFLHETDRAQLENWEQQAAGLGDGEFLERDVRVRHVNGAFRWFAVRETVCTRTSDGTASRILGIAQDVSARKQFLDKAHARKLDLSQVARRLREFREELTLTQAEFGERFGGFDSRQIGTYERGGAEIPLKLVLSIHEQGYPLETVLGTGSPTILDETVLYMADAHRDQRIVEQLSEALLAISHRQREKTERIIAELGIPPQHLSANQRTMLELLAEVKKQVT